jgi:hypothetical protein
MNVLIENLKTQIATETLVKHVDEDWGQLDSFNPNPPVKWPCVLISLQSGTFSDIGQDKTNIPINRQMGEVLVELRIADLKLTNSNSKAPLNQRTRAMSILELVEAVHKKVQGFSPGHDNTNTNLNGKLIRERFRFERREDGIQEYSVIYSISITNC